MRKTSGNNLRPRHTPTWLAVALLSGMWVAAVVVQEHFQLAIGWFAVAAYIILLFVTIVLAFRPAWGKTAFWQGTCALFGLHVLAGLVMLLFPTWLQSLHSFLTVVVVADLLLTMSVLWRFTVAHSRA